MKRQRRTFVFRRKLIAMFLLLGVVPFTLFTLRSYRVNRARMIEQETELLRDSLNSAMLSVDNQLDACQAVSSYIFNDSSLLTALNQRYGTNYFRMYETYAKLIAPSFNTYYALYATLRRITVYTDCDLLPCGNYASPLDKLATDEPWTQSHAVGYNPSWILPYAAKSGELVCIRRIGMPYIYPTVNILYLSIDADRVFRPFAAISAYPCDILIDAGNGLTAMHSGISGADETDWQDAIAGRSVNYSAIHARMASTGWDVYCLSRKSDILSVVDQAILTTYLIALLFILVPAIASVVLIANLTRPIEELANKMQAFGRGDMNVRIPERNGDELGQLQHSFNEMTERIRTLIEVTYKDELEKQNYQQRLLQAQINPHFLYNSLSIINSMAIMANQSEISETATQLSRFYRSALNHGKDMTTVENELENIHAYIALHLSQSAGFTPHFDVDPALYPARIPNFILQPFVENAIEHGLRPCERDGLELSLRVCREGDRLVFIIRDNGVGMDAGKMESLLTERASGYGIGNVYARLRLHYGERCEVRFDSQPDRYTVVTIVLPLEGLA